MRPLHFQFRGKNSLALDLKNSNLALLAFTKNFNEFDTFKPNQPTIEPSFRTFNLPPTNAFSCLASYLQAREAVSAIAPRTEPIELATHITGSANQKWWGLQARKVTWGMQAFNDTDCIAPVCVCMYAWSDHLHSNISQRLNVTSGNV